MRRTLLTVFVSLGLMAAFSSSVYAAESDLVTAGEPERILEIAKQLGNAELTTTSAGDPRITGKMKDQPYVIFFYGCKENKNCTQIQLTALWKGYDVSAESVEKWSWDRGSFTKAHMDSDKNLWLRMPINLAKGVSLGNLKNSFMWWSILTASFEKEVLKKKN